MEILIILCILLLWLHLTQNINKVSGNISELKKEIEKLRQADSCKEEKKTVVPASVSKQTESATPKTPHSPITGSIPALEAIKTSVLQSVPAIPNVVADKPEIKKAAPKPRKKINYEKLIGENLFGKIGILVLIFGIGLFVKYAIDNEWINETMRTILSFLAGSGLLGFAQYLHKKYRTFSSLLAGGAFAIFYITTAIAFHYYGLFSQTGAFIILVATTLFMSLLSILYDRRELAIISLTGGFLAPFLVSSGEGSYLTLFTYILILDSGMFVLAIYKKWRELPIISFGFTWLCLFIYILATSLSSGTASHLLIFATVFYLLFLFPVIYILKKDPQNMGKMLLIVLSSNNFIYMGLGLTLLSYGSYSLKMSGLLTLFIALANLLTAIGLKKVLSENNRLLFTLLGSAVTFVSITIPLQLEGNYITIFWASEMVLLLWLFHKSGYRIYHYFSMALIILTLISWRMDLNEALDSRNLQTSMMFLNGVFFSNIFVGIAYLGYSLLCRKHNSMGKIQGGEQKKWNFLCIATFFTGIIAGWMAFDMEFRIHISDRLLASSVRMLFNTFYILLISGLLQRRFPSGKYTTGYVISALCNVLQFIYLSLLIHEAWVSPEYMFFPWATLGFLIVHLVIASRGLCKQYDVRSGNMQVFLVGLNVVACVLSLFATYILLIQTGLKEEFSAGFSICLTLAGFTQMILGMRLHLRILRIISIVTLGIVIGKLSVIDLWTMTTVGKIVVFIILGVILLLLSFMYQKLKEILTKNDPDEK